ncbi:MAG: hypothetical protein FH749_11665 [Firmicutes bacterium]|nr:hypothetical protein [Bacillota bacterium]
MGIRSCQCPERLTDFIGQEITVETMCGDAKTGTLVEVADDYIELSAVSEEFGPIIILVLCCYICSFEVIVAGNFIE